MALHGQPGNPAERYITRMQQAVRVLYGQASPSEAFESTTLELQPLDLNRFLQHVAGNAGYIGIEAVPAADWPGIGRGGYLLDPDGNVFGLISPVLSDGTVAMGGGGS